MDDCERTGVRFQREQKVIPAVASSQAPYGSVRKNMVCADFPLQFGFEWQGTLSGDLDPAVGEFVMRHWSHVAESSWGLGLR